MAYIESAGRDDEDGACIFCDALEGDPASILLRTEKAFVMLNAFPYNSGHVMVAPNRHVGDTSDLDPAERGALMDLVCRMIDALRAAMGPHGFNVGMNLGRIAGAGVPGHLHMHVVPRWGGDTNFMPVVADTKVLPELLDDTRRKLAPHLAG